MQNRRHKLAIIGVCLIGILGFKDTGIFVKDFVSIQEDKTEVTFVQEEKVNVLRETDKTFIINKNGMNYEVPMDTLIRKEKKTQKYRVLEDSFLLNDTNGTPVASIKQGDVLQVLDFVFDFGYFETVDGKKGYVYLPRLEVIIEENITYGIAKADMGLVNGDLTYTVLKDHYVAIKNFADGHYILLDDNGNEFRAAKDSIELRATNTKVTRGAPVRDSRIDILVEAAQKELGKPYIYAGTGPKGFDCSGLTYSLFLNNLGIKLNRRASDQAKQGIEVSRQNLQAGDLVFFRTSGSGIGHVGLYIGNNNMIHASSGRARVMVSSMDESYYKTRYVTARRILQ